jgi:L-asparaginase
VSGTPARRLQILHTGGTIGMGPTPHGLAPRAGLEMDIRKVLATMPPADLPDWSFQEIQPLHDSADVLPSDWGRLAELIRASANGANADAVLVLHGTDTLAYTASALSYLLSDIRLPVVLTGSMAPLDTEGTDAIGNLTGAVRALHRGVGAGVHIYFHGCLMNGLRVTKYTGTSDNAFASLRDVTTGTPTGVVPNELSPAKWIPAAVAILTLYPGFHAEQIEHLASMGIRGLVLECYGSGTGPGDQRFIAALKAAVDAGMVVVAVTQCPAGGVDLDTYATGQHLRSAQVIGGRNLTREAAFAKLHYLIGIGLPATEVARWMLADLCGEFGALPAAACG